MKKQKKKHKSRIVGIRAVQYNGMCDSLSGKGGTCMYTLIIVDDDELIRKGLEKVIQWGEDGVFGVGNI